jgi:hypothetical protein
MIYFVESSVGCCRLKFLTPGEASEVFVKTQSLTIFQLYDDTKATHI